MKRNTQPITKKLVADNRLIFLPETVEEAQLLVKQAAAFGVKEEEVTSPQRYVDTGMTWRGGQVYCKTSGESFEAGLLCTVQQLDPSYRSSDEILMEKFNALAADVAEIKAAVLPATVNKRKGQTL